MDAKEAVRVVRGALSALGKTQREAVQLAVNLLMEDEVGNEPSSPPSSSVRPTGDQDPKGLSELEERIMAELEKREELGAAPRELGKILLLGPKAHQTYAFRKAMLRLVLDGRIVRLDADNPKKLRYVTSCFAGDKS